ESHRHAVAERVAAGEAGRRGGRGQGRVGGAGGVDVERVAGQGRRSWVVAVDVERRGGARRDVERVAAVGGDVGAVEAVEVDRWRRAGGVQRPGGDGVRAEAEVDGDRRGRVLEVGRR